MEKHLLYDDMYVGMEFEEVIYELNLEQVERYVEAVEEKNPVFTDPDKAKKAGFEGSITPPTIAALFTTLRVALKDHKMPPGAVHAKQYYRFIKPIRPGERLRIRVKIVDKYLKKSRNYAVIESDVFNEIGEHLLTGRMSGIWPE
jgi:acyl dehydratase